MAKTMYTESIYEGVRIIAADQEALERVKAVLEVIKAIDQKAFEKVTKNLKIIFTSPAVKEYNYTDVKRRAWACSDDLFADPLDEIYLASLLLHESHHIAQYRSGHQCAGAKAEEKATQLQRDFLERHGHIAGVHWLDKQFEGKWWRDAHEGGREKPRKELKKEFLNYLRDH